MECNKIHNGYTFKEYLGGGTSGQVYRAIKNEHQYAIKCCFPKEEDAMVEKSVAENVKLKCPFLVKYHETFMEDKQLFIVMDLCEQGDLADIIQKAKVTGFSLKNLMKIFIQLILGLYELHNNGILHRDVKPANMFVDADNNVKMGDFGCGKIMEFLEDKLQSMTGTPAYNSPEIMRGLSYGAKADVWSLGVMMYQLATLRLPFEGNVFQLVLAIPTEPFVPISKSEVNDEQVVAVIHSMLEKDPSRRPSPVDLLKMPVIVEYAMDLDLVKFFPGVPFPLSMEKHPQQPQLLPQQPHKPQPFSPPPNSIYVWGRGAVQNEVHMRIRFNDEHKMYSKPFTCFGCMWNVLIRYRPDAETNLGVFLVRHTFDSEYWKDVQYCVVVYKRDGTEASRQEKRHTFCDERDSRNWGSFSSGIGWLAFCTDRHCQAEYVNPANGCFTVRVWMEEMGKGERKGKSEKEKEKEKK